MYQNNQIWTVNRNKIQPHPIVPTNRDETAVNKSTIAEKKPPKKKYAFQNWWIFECLKNFCSSTALHGYNHIVRDSSTFKEQIAWIIIVIVGIIGGIIMLTILWTGKSTAVTVTVIESTYYPTWNVPFPAITICNFNRISKKAAYRMAGIFKRPNNMSIDEMAFLFRAVLRMRQDNLYGQTDYVTLQNVLRLNDMSTDQLIKILSPQCNDFLLRCMWKGTQTRCDSIFQAINTTEGVCCSFNYLGLSTHNFPKKLINAVPKSPRRVTACGYQSGLTVLLKPFLNDYFATYLSSRGFRILLHNSYDYPDDNSEIKVVSTLTENFINLIPESTYATADVREQYPQIRNCLFHDERKMHVMQHYSYRNCMSECRAQLMFDFCGCVPPDLPNNGSTARCELDKIQCLAQHRKIVGSSLPGLNLTNVKRNGSLSSSCDCPPDCELLSYPGEITTGVLRREFTYTNENFFKGITIEDELLVHIYFSDLVSTRYRRDVYQNWLSFLASFGGILGLFLGFSIISGFEFIYYLTLRPIFDYFST